MPVVGGAVLAFTRMNHILEVDRENLITVVEPGVITFVLQEEVCTRPFSLTIRSAASGLGFWKKPITVGAVPYSHT